MKGNLTVEFPGFWLQLLLEQMAEESVKSRISFRKWSLELYAPPTAGQRDFIFRVRDETYTDSDEVEHISVPLAEVLHKLLSDVQ